VTHPYSKDPISFAQHAGPFNRQDVENGPLAEMTFVAKDLFDVKGLKSGTGNPTWLETHDIAQDDSWAVSRLLSHGARLIGKSLTDEMAYSLIGANYHYGTPPNPAAPDRIPGGSSSGSASIVAQGLADFALGTDTGGSVRIPASFCGILGFRPTHGRIPVEGLVPLGPSFDTVGWFARNAGTLKTVGDTLLKESDTAPRSRKLVRLDDIFLAADQDCQPLLDKAFTMAARHFESHASTTIAGNGFDEWRDTYRFVQGYEAWQEHGTWIETCQPAFGPLTQARFDFARSISEADFKKWADIRENLKQRVLDIIGDNGILCLPSAPGAAIRRDGPEPAFDEFRARILDFTAYAGMCGAPQATIPVGVSHGGPIGLSFISAPGSDLNLLEIIETLSMTDS